MPARHGEKTREEEEDMSEKIYNVLFICTGNCARSINQTLSEKK
jgi:hypothetical protein